MATRRTRLKDFPKPGLAGSRPENEGTKPKPTILPKSNVTPSGHRQTGRLGRCPKMNITLTTPNPPNCKKKTLSRQAEMRNKNQAKKASSMQPKNNKNAEKEPMMQAKNHNKMERTPARKCKTKCNGKTEKTSAKQSRGNHKAATKTSNKPDAYVFDETDEHVNKDSESPQMAFKTPFTTIVSKKLKTKKHAIPSQSKGNKKKELAALSKPVKMKCENKHVKKVEEKKTSTPLVSDSAGIVTKEKEHAGRKRKSLRISCVPALNLDLTVTPILSVSSSISPKEKARQGYDPQIDSFVAAPKGESSSLVILSSATVKHKTRGQVSFNLPTSPLQFADDEDLNRNAPGTQLSCTMEKNLKRKYTESKFPIPKTVTTNSEVVNAGCTTKKRQKVDHPKLIQNHLSSKQQSKASKHKSSSPPNVKRSSKKQVVKKSKETPVLHSKKSAQEHMPTTSTPASHKEVEELGLWQPGNEMYCTSSLYDSGISMGSDASKIVSSFATPSLPGFMEDEPLQSELDDLSSSPLSSPQFGPSTNTSNTQSTSVEPASSLNRSSSKEYKPLKFKTKREKGRYSTGKMDAWASAMNQSLQDVESFELVVE